VDAKYSFADFVLPLKHSMEINLLDIEFNAIANIAKYEMMLLPNWTKPFASTPTVLTIKGLNKKLIPIDINRAIILAVIFIANCLFLLKSVELISLITQ
jgi:hypothetical protein